MKKTINILDEAARVLEGFERFLSTDACGTVQGHVAYSINEIEVDPIEDLEDSLTYYLQNQDDVDLGDLDVSAVHGAVFGMIEKKYDLKAIIKSAKGRAA